MRLTPKLFSIILSLVSLLTVTPSCSDSADGSPADVGGDASETCTAAGIFVVAVVIHDDRDGTVKDSALVNLSQANNPEAAADCNAEVVLVVGSEEVTLEQTATGQYEAGYSDLVANLPELTLVPGDEHLLEIDLDNSGSVDVTGAATLSDITSFRTTSVTTTQVTFTWGDAGDVGNTLYSVQVSDEQDFTFADNFASGSVEGTTTIQFGDGSEWPYFSAGPPLYARVQTDTSGSITSEGRFSAWSWPEEPILQY